MRKIKLKHLEEKVLNKEVIEGLIDDIDTASIAELMLDNFCYGAYGAECIIDTRNGNIYTGRDTESDAEDIYCIRLAHLDCTYSLPELEVDNEELTEEEIEEEREMRIEYLIDTLENNKYENVDEFYEED